MIMPQRPLTNITKKSEQTRSIDSKGTAQHVSLPSVFITSYFTPPCRRMDSLDKEVSYISHI